MSTNKKISITFNLPKNRSPGSHKFSVPVFHPVPVPTIFPISDPLKKTGRSIFLDSYLKGNHGLVLFSTSHKIQFKRLLQELLLTIREKYQLPEKLPLATERLRQLLPLEVVLASEEPIPLNLTGFHYLQNSNAANLVQELKQRAFRMLILVQTTSQPWIKQELDYLHQLVADKTLVWLINYVPKEHCE